MTAAWKFFTTKKQWELYLKELLKTNDTALLKAIVLIHGRQTALERQNKESTEENGVGFSKHDAKEMSEIAEKLQRGEELTAGEMAKSRNKMGKYWEQLMNISLEQQKREQQKREEQEAEEELRRQEETKAERQQQFEESIEIMRRCAEKGISCDYGICDECPVTQGLQMRLNLKEAEERCGEEG